MGSHSIRIVLPFMPPLVGFAICYGIPDNLTAYK